MASIPMASIAVPSVAAATSGGDFFDSAQYTSAFSAMDSCVSSVAAACESNTVVPCYCPSVNNYISSYNDCYSSGNSIAGTTLWDAFTAGDEYYTALSEECSDVFTETPFSANTRFTTPHVTPTATPIFEPVSISYVASLPTTTYPTESVWSGTGSLLVGYCATPEYTLVNAGATVFWAPVVGCQSDKPDCCPSPSTDSAVSTFTSFAASTAPTITINIGSSPTSSGLPGPGGQSDALNECPDDYQSISDGCCPSGYQLWGAAFGHGSTTPCFSVLPDQTTAPPIYELTSQPATNATRATSTTSSTTLGAPTSAVVNIVYAVHYPVKRSSGLPHSTIVAIAVSCTIGALLIGAIMFLSLWTMKRMKKLNTGTVDTVSKAVTFNTAQESSISPQQTRPITGVQFYAEPQLSIPPEYQALQKPVVTVSPLNGLSYEAQAPSEMGQGHLTTSQMQQAAPVLSPLGAMPNTVSPVSQPQELHDPHWQGRHELQGQS